MLYIYINLIRLQAAQAAIANGVRRRELAKAVHSAAEGHGTKREKKYVDQTSSTKVTPDVVKKHRDGVITPRTLSFSEADADAGFLLYNSVLFFGLLQYDTQKKSPCCKLVQFYNV
jgi:hypothetical protein